MTQARYFIATGAAIALTFGITGKTLSPVEQEEPVSTGDILIVTNDTAAGAGQTRDAAARPDHRNPTTDNSSGETTVAD
jgi:hypothetical protein